MDITGTQVQQWPNPVPATVFLAPAGILAKPVRLAIMLIRATYVHNVLFLIAKPVILPALAQNACQATVYQLVVVCIAPQDAQNALHFLFAKNAKPRCIWIQHLSVSIALIIVKHAIQQVSVLNALWGIYQTLTGNVIFVHFHPQLGEIVLLVIRLDAPPVLSIMYLIQILKNANIKNAGHVQQDVCQRRIISVFGSVWVLVEEFYF
mmetsp:Transcript_52738/g.60615  ORF Transcript_52738/g.60615 Transcript_52738/m.60615 type:complete len:207 (+) Transcript_52738:215-835(+)